MRALKRSGASDVNLIGFELVRYPMTRIVAVALRSIDSADIEPFLVTLDDAGGSSVEGDVLFPLGINQRAIVGSVRFERLAESAREQIARPFAVRASGALLRNSL